MATWNSATGPTPLILSAATAVPAFELDQTAVRDRAMQIFAANGKDISRLLPVFENAGIRRRYSCVPIDWYSRKIGWRERNLLYLRHATDLLAKAAAQAIQAAQLLPGQIDQVVCVSTTGVATPSLDARLIGRIGLRPDVARLPIFGLGCAGGVLGLNRAAALARALPGSRVLLLVVELCALTFRVGDNSKSNIVATALFGDGAAACVISTEDTFVRRDPGMEAPAVVGIGEHTWPDSLDVMGWNIEDDGLGVLFSRDIPAIVDRDFGDAAVQFLAAHGVDLQDLTGAICHPGGAKVVPALERALGFPDGSMTDAREILRDFGNMSAATVMFMLERALRRAWTGRKLMSALGPGFTAGFTLIER
jgi:alkylresorcinol/alkylpyrone synthase